MKTLITHFTILILMLTCFNLYAQHRSVTKRIDSLSLDYYLEDPTYLINKNYVVFEYQQTRKIIYADIPSFRVSRFVRDCGIASDKNGVYFRGKLLKIDTAGLRTVGEGGNYRTTRWLWKTNKKVFEDSVELRGIDAKSFEAIDCINGGYFRDKNFIYYFDKKIKGSDPGTVNKTCADICYDKNNVYNKGKIMYYNNHKLFPVNDVLTKTQNEVIAYVDRGGLQVSSIDASTLRGLSKNYAVNKYHVYYDTTALPIKPKNFKNIRLWNPAYISDGVNVYYGTDLDITLDGASFGVLSHSNFYYDKNICTKVARQRKKVNK
jgi:hypothetical protein